MLVVAPSATPITVDRLAPGAAEPGRVARYLVSMTENAAGRPTLVPALVLRSAEPGPVVGITAAIHGNELNGIPVIHRLMQELEQGGLLHGAVVAIPIANVPGYVRQQREFEDGVDLNRIMPGDPKGAESAQYAHALVERVVSCFDYLLDLHTASFGRENSLYVRADMNDSDTARLARLIAPQIIVHSENDDRTLRGTATKRGITSVTIEVGDPQRLQHGMVRSARLGLQEVLEHLGLIPDISDPVEESVIECKRSYWMYSDRGGIMSMLCEVTEMVEAGQPVARLRDVWGDVVCEYVAPERGVVVGRSTNPAARAGSRIIHLGVPI